VSSLKGPKRISGDGVKITKQTSTWGGGAMAYYKFRIEVWCDWNPAESDLGDIAQRMGVGEAICTMREVLAVVNRPQDIEDEEAMSFFGGSEGDADESQG
jgi:hypothetical protein